MELPSFFVGWVLQDAPCFSQVVVTTGEWCVLKDTPYEFTYLRLMANSTVLGLAPACLESASHIALVHNALGQDPAYVHGRKLGKLYPASSSVACLSPTLTLSQRFQRPAWGHFSIVSKERPLSITGARSVGAFGATRCEQKLARIANGRSQSPSRKEMARKWLMTDG